MCDVDGVLEPVSGRLFWRFFCDNFPVKVRLPALYQRNQKLQVDHKVSHWMAELEGYYTQNPPLKNVMLLYQKVIIITVDMVTV